MQGKIYLKELDGYEATTEHQKEYMGLNPAYDLDKVPSQKMREELEDFIKYRSGQIGIVTLFNERVQYNLLCRFLQKHGRRVKSFRDREKKIWMRQLKGWMLQEGIPLTRDYKEAYGKITPVRSRLTAYLEMLLEFLEPEDTRDEREKNIWELKKLDIDFQANPIKNYNTLNFTKIYQEGIREEAKKGIYLNLQCEAIATVSRELTAMRRLSKFLREKHPEIQSCQDIDREVLEDYLTFLKTEETSTKEFHSELTRLRGILESIGKVLDYPHLEGLFLNRDIPPTHRGEFKVYSDAELKRLNASIVKMDAQIARAMVIHQMLGTRISDTLTLQTDCLYEKDGETIIRIRQMKTKSYQKPISPELAALIRKAIEYTKGKHGETEYIFVNENDPSKPLQYGTIQSSVVRMIHKEDLRDDNGRHFGFGTHMYRHNYGMKLTEMHLDDWTLARLLGHSNLRNVKYYRRMGNQMLAEETRRARNKLSEMILGCLDGWEEEYEQIRQDDSLE